MVGVLLITTNFTDKRDNNTYSTFKLRDKIWLKENLKYLFKESSNISYKVKNYYDKFGAYYTRKSALKACPEGFGLASLKEYKDLFLKLKGENNLLQGKKVSEEELSKYGFLLGGLTKGKKIAFANSIGFYWTSTDTLKINSKKPKEGKKKYFVGIHIYKDKESDAFNIEPTYMPAKSKNFSSIAINAKCVKRE